MQGWRSISALFWPPDKAGVRGPPLILFPFVGDHFSFCSPRLVLGTSENAWVTQHFGPLLGHRDGRGEGALSDFPLCWGPFFILLPALGVGESREWRGGVSFLPSFGPPRREG